jgi:hypothetical protein
MRTAFVTVMCSAVVSVAASLLVLPDAAQAQCGGGGPQGWWCGPPSCGGPGVQAPGCPQPPGVYYEQRGYRLRYGDGFYERREREERRERRRRDFYEGRRYYWR